jgi:catechol 2,3-dioxygenase-like lactoylglutathione lyase family enzyme
MTTVSVRYVTDDVDAAVAFYAERLGFNVEMRPGPGFAMLSRGDLRLLLNRPGAGGAGQAMPDGRRPDPGGWNRIQTEVSDLDREVRRCARLGPASVTRSSRAGAAARSCSRTLGQPYRALPSPPAPEHSSFERRP